MGTLDLPSGGKGGGNTLYGSDKARATGAHCSNHRPWLHEESVHGRLIALTRGADSMQLLLLLLALGPAEDLAGMWRNCHSSND